MEDSKIFKTLPKALKYMELWMEGMTWKHGRNGLNEFKQRDVDWIKARVSSAKASKVYTSLYVVVLNCGTVLTINEGEANNYENLLTVHAVIKLCSEDYENRYTVSIRTINY